ncbi:protein FAR1-RELATED SEQUENCE 5 [Citrus sinensis]|uniref:Protein FAR1-RELATED SEQUENCE 5 n=1 Tax=Citrus sinensis TaxID=2711 RepID=A0ACB8M301_CITSI|nr:protein FAR1-RELATED SEQUENCE 5 [Citrus sinensis]
MSSDVDSEADSDIAYEIVDVVETGSFSDSEDGCPDESGDELPTLTGGAHFQAPIPSENNPSQSHLHGEIGTAEGQTTNYEVLKSMDVVGKEFASEEKAELFFTEYARAIGFGVRRHNKRWNTKGMLIGRIWVCSKQGFRSKKFLARDNRKREARPITRTGCEVEFRIGAKQGESGWVCTHFNGKHNHTLTPPQQVHYIRSHRRITEPDLAAASSLNKVGVRPSQIHEYMVDKCGGYREVGYLRRDVQNRLDDHKRRQLKESDAETCLSYLEGKKSADHAFYYDFTVTENNRLGDLFWCDGGARADYAIFGDVIAFDATYRTNAYRKPFVVLLGVNHHRRTIVFGFALLSDETEHTYTWLLHTFLSAMEGKQPKTVITDGDKAMRNAISKKFPHSHHRLCCWHLGRNAQANVNKEFTSDFRRCMLRAYTKDRFEQKWKEMVECHNVETHEWVLKMYREKTMWAEAYLRGEFFGGMRSTQRSEGLNAYLNHYVSIKLRLIAFVKQMDRLIDRQREVEGKDDFDSTDGRPVLMTHMKPFESAAADVYTRPIFRLVRDQILQEGMHIAVQVSCEENYKSFTVKKWKVLDEEWRVNIQGKWDNVSCDCLMIETLGIPCSHMFAVMKVENVDSIPHSMILARWTKKAKLGLSSEVQCTLRQHYMSVDVRMGSLHAACRTLQKVAAKSCEAYELAIARIHKLSMQLEPMSCEMAKEKPKGNLGRRFDVNDPVVVLTKGCGKKLKMGPSQRRKCSRCGNGGHTVRKCKIIIQPDGDHNDNPNQSSQFMGENTALPATRRSGIIDKGKEHNRTNEYDQHCSQQSHNGHATSSNLWYQPYAMSTDNDSTEDTMLQHLLPDYVVHHASASTFASTYANIWGGNQI